MAVITIAGTLYSDEGVTPITAGCTLAVSVNGAATILTVVTSVVDGTYLTAGLTSVAGDVLTVYIQDGVNSQKAVTVTRSTGANLTGIDLYQNYLGLRSDDGTALSGTNLNTSDNNGDSGITSIYAAVSNTSTVLAAGKSLCIQTGQVYAPGGSSAITVKGSWLNNGTFTAGTSTVSFQGVGSFTIKSNGSSFASVTFSGGPGTYTLTDALTAPTQVSQANSNSQTLDVSASNYGVSTNVFSFLSGTFTARAGTVTLTGTGGTLRNNGSFWHLSIGGATGTYTVSTTALTVGGNLTIGVGKTLSSSSLAVIVGGNWNNSGTFTTSTGTVTLNGVAQTLSGSTTFYNIVASTSGDVISVTDGTTQTITNALTLQNVTLQGTSTGGYTVACPATQTVDHLTISRCTATGNTLVAGATSTDGGNNVNVTFGSGGLPGGGCSLLGL